VINATPRSRYLRERDAVPIVQEARRAPGPVWTFAEGLAPQPGFDPRTVQSLYRLIYPGRHILTAYHTPKH